MKLTNEQLKQIIKEELQNLINEEELDNEEEFGPTEQDKRISEFRSWLVAKFGQAKFRKYKHYMPHKLKPMLDAFYEETKNKEVYNAVIDAYRLKGIDKK